MKEALKFVTTVAIVTSVMYLYFSYYNAEFNIALWTEGCRAFAAFTSVMISAAVSTYIVNFGDL